MAVTDAYASAATYRAMFGKTDTSQDAAILVALTAVSRYLDRRLGRFFTRDVSVVTRRYYPTSDSQKTLFVDDIATKTGLIVKVDDNQDGTAEVTLTETTDFEVLPFDVDKGPEPQPWTQLYLPTKRVSRISWASITEITASFGWPAIPSAIERATCELTAIVRIESPRATNQMNVGFDAIIGTSRQAQDIIDDLSRKYAKPLPVFA